MKLAQAMIFVKDIERMRAFYQDTLGLRPIEATRLPNYIEFESGFSLHSIPADVAAIIEVSSPPLARETSAVKLTFETPDLAATQVRLRSLGVPALARAWGATDWLDPEGNVFGVTS